MTLAACGGAGPTQAPTAPTTGGIEESPALALHNERFAPGSAAEDTQPSVSPAIGGITTKFRLALTAKESLGVQGLARRDYMIVLQGPHARCAEFTLIDAGARGARVKAHLAPPYELGWCHGTYRGAVVLETSAVCAPPKHGAKPAPCSAATNRVEVGHFSFQTR